MTDKRWRVNIYTPQSTSLSTTNVYYRTTVLGGPVTVRGPILRPLLGRSEAQPWTVDLLDDGSSFTAKLADSTGRLVMLGRICSVERNLGGAGFAFQGAGRITDIQLGQDPDIAYYRLTIEDERRVERQTTIFNSTNTTRLYPGGPHTAFAFIGAPPKGTITVLYRSTLNAKWAYVSFRMDTVRTMQDATVNLIRDDLKDIPMANALSSADPNSAVTNSSRSGNFKNLRLRVGTRDYGIISLGDAVYTVAPGVRHRPSVDFLKNLDTYKQPGTALQCWVWATSSQLSLGQSYSCAFLHAFGMPPSPSVPLHIGSSIGLHPITVLRRITANNYTAPSSGSTNRGMKPRYSTAALDVLAATAMPGVNFRIVSAAIEADWLEANIFQPFLIAPVVDQQGRVAPVSMRLPNSTTVITKTLSGANVRRPYPTWDHIGREQVTQIRIVTDRLHVFDQASHDYLASRNRLDNSIQYGADLLAVTPTTLVVMLDRSSNFGIRPMTIRAAGVHPPTDIGGFQQILPTVYDGGNVLAPTLKRYAAWVIRDIFDRFGDGPTVARVLALTTAENISAGDWVKVQVPQYPNAPNRIRGGTLVGQVEQRDDTPAGPEYQVRYAGPSLSAPAAPTLTLSTSTSDPKHQLYVSVNNKVGWRAELIASTVSPSSASSAWVGIASGNTTKKTLLGQLPAGKTFWARAAVAQPGRLRSAWSVSTKKTTQILSPPTAIVSTTVKKTFFTGTWTPGEADPPFTDVHVDTSTTAILGSSNRYARLSEPGAARLKVENLASKTKYLFAVRHADMYGGYSAAAKAAITTSSGASTGCPPPLGIVVLLGG